MSFFLLGKGPEGDLWLLSPDSLDSRQAAMGELSRLTADPTFAHWDAEVFVMELDKGTPVLLVRPAEKPAEPADKPAEESAVLEAETEAEGPVEADAEELAAEAPEAEEPEAEEPEAEEPEAEEPEAEEAHEPDPALAAVIQDLGDDEALVTQDATVVEADDVPLVEPTSDVESATLEPVAGADAGFEEGTDSLRDALMRTAAHMESEGVVAPESVGAVPEGAAADPVATEAVSLGAATDSEPTAAWPWDTQASDGFALDALEEPAREATPLVTAAGDDETVAASRPVILGSYGESAPTEATLPDGGLPEAVPVAEPVVAEALGDASSPDASDFILDLEPVGAPSVAQDMTCENCVYVRTCPNKDQRDPKTCGSFQWK